MSSAATFTIKAEPTVKYITEINYLQTKQQEQTGILRTIKGDLESTKKTLA
jgi:hypothetical protein